MNATAAAPRKHDVGVLAWQVGLPVALVILWEVGYRIYGAPALASPLQSAGSLVSGINGWWADIADTLSALAIAFPIAAIAGTLIGASIGLSAFVTETLRPLLVAAYALPKVIFYPVFLLIFGVSFPGKVAFGVFHGIFPVIIIVMEAVQLVPRVYLRVGAVHQLSFLQTVRSILIPAVTPQLLGSWRTCFNLTFLGVIFSEMFASYRGLGYRLMQYMSSNHIDDILAIFVIIVVIAVAVNLTLVRIETTIDARNS
jgi:NitT/TauT family transport system permease protein